MIPPQRAGLVSFLDDLASRADPVFVRHTPYRRFAWTGTDTRAAALALVGRLRPAVVPGDRVLLAGPDSPEWVAAFLGIAASGGIVVPLDVAAPDDFLRRVATKTAARAAILPAGDLPRLAGIVPLLFPLEEIRPAGEPARPHPARSEETAEIVFTSGTTTEPKGVELTSANLLAPLAGIEAGFLKRRRYLTPLLPFRFLCLVPLSHLFGQSLGILIPILLRSTSVFSSTLEPHRLLRLVRDEHPIAIITVPRVLAGLRDALLRELERRGARAGFERGLRAAEGRRLLRRVLATRAVRRVLGWRTHVLVVGGAALDPELETFWTRCGFLVVQGYGMTEAAPIITVQNPLDGRVHTLGRPVKDVEIRLAADGEVLVRGPNVMKGYYGDPEATRAAIQDGWLRTGDLAERDAEGRLFFKGRKKDVIVLPGGLNVHPSDVEGVLRSIEGVRDAVVFAGKGDRGDEVHAVVVGSANAERVRAAANERLLPHQRVRRLMIWEEADFPRTSTGKARRAEIAATAKVARGANTTVASGPVAEALARLGLAGRVPPGGGARLVEDLGLDSLEMLDLVSLLEEEHDVRLTDPEGSAALTVPALERMIEEERSRSTKLAMPRWGRTMPLRVLRAVARPLLLRPAYSIFVHLDVEGAENVPAGPEACIVVANHTSMLDAPTILFALPASVRGRLAPAMTTEALLDHFEPEGKPTGARMRSAALYAVAAGLFAAYPLPRTGFRPSLEYTGEMLDAGFWPLVFPEGHMTRDRGRMLPFKSGVALLARETRASILPVYLQGLAEILPPDRRWPLRRGRARARIGAPITAKDLMGLDVHAATRRIEEAVRTLRNPD